MIQIYGASDDVVVVKGDITEEFTPSPEGELILGFSTGHAVRIRFTDSGVWRIESCTTPKLDTLSQAPEGDEDIYSDRATILAPVRWVVAGREAVFSAWWPHHSRRSWPTSRSESSAIGSTTS